MKTKHVVLSATLALAAVLSACSKPGDAVIPPKDLTKAEPTADPAKAVVANAKADAEIKKAAEGANATDAEKAAKAERGEINVQAADTLTANVVDDLKKSAAIADQEAKNKLANAGETLVDPTKPPASIPSAVAVDPTAVANLPKADAGKVDAAASNASTTAPSTPAAPTAPSADASAPAPAPVAAPIAADPPALSKGAIEELRPFVLSMLKASIWFNYEIAKDRIQVEALKDVKTVPAERKIYLAKIRGVYGLKMDSSLEEILARVDVINTSFAIPTLISELEPSRDPKMNRDNLSTRMMLLNTSEGDAHVAYRNKRAQQRKAGTDLSSIEQMEAYLMVSKTAPMKVEQHYKLSIVRATMAILAEKETQKILSGLIGDLRAKGDKFMEVELKADAVPEVSPATH